jgi:hypothetical protein
LPEKRKVRKCLCGGERGREMKREKEKEREREKKKTISGESQST